MTRIAIAVGLIASISLFSAELNAAAPVGKEHIYKKIDGRELKLYVTHPKEWNAGDDRPAVVFFHGGGWVGGSPGQFTEHSKHVAEHGMVAVQVQYRLLSRKNAKQTPQQCIADAKSAMRWVRKHANELGIDTDRIATAGGSAGGHLAAALGTIDGHDEKTDDLSISVKPQAMILFNPVYDNGPGGWGTGRVGDRFKEFSPMHNIDEKTPPAIVFLGTEDRLIPVKTGKTFEQKMKAAGVHSELHLYQGEGHGFFNFREGKGDNKIYIDTLNKMDSFLKQLGWLPVQSESEESGTAEATDD